MTDWNRFRQTDDGKFIDLAQPYLAPMEYPAAFLAAERRAETEIANLTPAQRRAGNEFGKTYVKAVLLFWGCVFALLVYTFVKCTNILDVIKSLL
jgi:hypothetical protein